MNSSLNADASFTVVSVGSGTAAGAPCSHRATSRSLDRSVGSVAAFAPQPATPLAAVVAVVVAVVAPAAAVVAAPPVVAVVVAVVAFVAAVESSSSSPHAVATSVLIATIDAATSHRSPVRHASPLWSDPPAGAGGLAVPIGHMSPSDAPAGFVLGRPR